MSNNLPLGAENDPTAPWNEPEPKIVDVKVDIDVIISKKMTIRMEEGYTNYSLYNALREYAYEKFPKEKNDWEVMDIDYEILR